MQENSVGMDVTEAVFAAGQSAHGGKERWAGTRRQFPRGHSPETGAYPLCHGMPSDIGCKTVILSACGGRTIVVGQEGSEESVREGKGKNRSDHKKQKSTKTHCTNIIFT